MFRLQNLLDYFNDTNALHMTRKYRNKVCNILRINQNEILHVTWEYRYLCHTYFYFFEFSVCIKFYYLFEYPSVKTNISAS